MNEFMRALNMARAHYAKAWGCDAAALESGFHVLESDGFEAVGFGHGVVIRALPGIAAWCREQFADVPPEFLFDGEHVYELETALRRHGMMLRGASTHYLLRDLQAWPLPEGFAYRLMARPEVNTLRPGKGLPFAFNGDGSDAIALAAEKDGRLMALTSADDLWGDMWQIGIQVLPEAQTSGLACGMVARLAREIVLMGKTPFYSTWAGNMGSTRTALKCGFYPAWLSMTAIPVNGGEN